MILENKLNLSDAILLAQAEEKISKQKAKLLFDSGDIQTLPIGTFGGLAAIHTYLFDDIYPFAGKIRTVNIAKGNFRFASVMYLEAALTHINAMPFTNFNEIVEKYVEMNVAHPFREGNGRAGRIWLDLMLKQGVKQVIDWHAVDKEAYLSAMQRSVVNDLEIKTLFKQALTANIHDRSLFMKGIDMSYFYEGYSHFKTEDV
jgi:cell filamentation protein